jgi:hypothetical protein
MRLLLFLLLCGSAVAQVTFGSPTSTTTAVLTVTPTGTGTGSISSADGYISNCSSSGGTCNHTYVVGALITLTPTITGGSGFAWSSGTDGASGCSGTGSCTFNITATASLTAVFTGSGSGAIPASPTFAIAYNQSTAFPVGINHGQGRIWDTVGAQWPWLNTAFGVYNWTQLDEILNLMTQNSVHTAQYGLARTPNWASSNTNLYVDGTLTSGTFTASETVLQTGSGVSTTFVSYSSGVLNIAQYMGTATAGGTWVGQTSGAIFTPSAVPQDICSSFTNGSIQPQQLPGQCAPPTDVATNGSGTDSIWRHWIAAIAGHVNQAGYIAGTGTWAAGGANCPGTVNCTHAHVAYWETWNEPDSTNFWIGSFDQLIRMEQDLYCIVKGGSFTIAATGETCSQVQTSVGLSGPIDTTASILMPSYHDDTTLLAKCFLYCQPLSAGTCGPSGQLGATSCVSGTAGAAQADGINFHVKPGVSGAETVVPTATEAINGILQSAELAKPLDNTEDGFGSGGWSCPGMTDCYTDPDMQAGYIARDYIEFFFNGWSNDAWYNWSTTYNGMGSTTANVAYGQLYNWMVGSVPGTCSVSGTVHTCTLTLPNSVAAAMIWDSVQYCYGTPVTGCTFSTHTVGSSYLSYLDLYGNPKVTITGHSMQIGIMPRLAQAQ